MNPGNPEPARRGFVSIVLLGGLILYGLTCAPGVLWQDSATFQFRVISFDLEGDLGLALAHPLYIILSRVFSLIAFGDPAFRVNLFSAVCAAGCLALAANLLLLLTRSRFSAACGVMLLAFSHTFWRHAVMAEVYSLYALALLAELCLLERYFTQRRATFLILALFICGLNVSNHLLALLHLPLYCGAVFFAVRKHHLRLEQLPLIAVAFVAGSMPYLLLILAKLFDGHPFIAVVKSALFGNSFADEVLNATVSPGRQILRTIQYFGLNFPTPLVLAAPLGILACWRNPRLRWFCFTTSTIFATAFVFAFRYNVPDQYVFFFPCYVLIPLVVATALTEWDKRSRLAGTSCLILAALPLAVYEIAPSVLKRYSVAIGFSREIPYRENYTYFLRPRMNGKTGTSRFVREALATAAPDGLITADSTIMNPLVFARDIGGIEPGVTLTRTADLTPRAPAVDLTPENVKQFADRGAAFAGSETRLPAWISEQFLLQRVGVLYQLKPKPPGGDVTPLNSRPHETE